MPTVTLNPGEIAELDRQDPDSASDGGFQGLLVRLQGKVNRATGGIDPDEKDCRTSHGWLLTTEMAVGRIG